MTDKDKPFLLICCSPIPGHVIPILEVAKSLHALNYHVTILTGPDFEPKISSAGLSFIPLTGIGASWAGEAQVEIRRKRALIPSGLAHFDFNCEHYFVNPIPSQHEGIQRALKELDAKYPGRPVILISESWFLGSLPGMLNAPLLHKPAGYISIGISALALSSIDHPPFGFGLPPPPDPDFPSSRALTATQNQESQSVFRASQAAFQTVLANLKASPSPYFHLDASVRLPDRFLQMCIPSLEYPRSDAPEGLRFTGGLRATHRSSGAVLSIEEQPEWWEELRENAEGEMGKGRKRVVAVTQGTVRRDYEELLWPTMKALAGRDDVLTVVILARQDAQLVAGGGENDSTNDVPANARVVDYLPYDAILPYCDVFITNGGYGSFQHAISHGVPVIVAGDTEEKMEIAARAAWCGAGVDVKSGRPSVETMRSAVEEVLGVERYRVKAKELMRVMEGYDPIKLVVENIEEVARAKRSVKI